MIYICGPMTGKPDFNRPAFNAYAAKLRMQGLAHFNPAQNGLRDDAPWEQHMRVDIRWLMACHELHRLPGWEDSRGALIEIDLAQKLGIPVLEAEL